MSLGTGCPRIGIVDWFSHRAFQLWSSLGHFDFLHACRCSPAGSFSDGVSAITDELHHVAGTKGGTEGLVT